MNVLVVDDSDVIRRMIVKTMDLADLDVGTVLEASNGREALDVMGRTWVDVVLADINMPVMDGLEMITHMRCARDLSAIPVVVVSTEGAERRIHELEQLGISAYLRKPFTPEQIRDVLGRIPGLPSDGRMNKTLQDVTCDVLERFALVFAEPASGEGSDEVHECLLGRAGMRGAIIGIMAVSAPLALCELMAENILGTEFRDGDSALRATDALGEITNMIAGHIATEIESREHTSLSPPIVTQLTPGEWQTMAAAPGAVQLDVEGFPLIVSLDLRRRS